MIKKYIATHFFESSSESESSPDLTDIIQFTNELHLHEGLIRPTAVRSTPLSLLSIIHSPEDPPASARRFESGGSFGFNVVSEFEVEHEDSSARKDSPLSQKSSLPQVAGIKREQGNQGNQKNKRKK